MWGLINMLKMFDMWFELFIYLFFVLLLEVYVRCKDSEFCLYLWDEIVIDVFKEFGEGLISVI